MTQEQFYDLQQLGQSITKYCRAMENFRAVKESRVMIAKNFRSKYPNMKVEAIREAIWNQEEEFAKAAQTEFNEMRINANSLGWNLGYKVAHDEITDMLHTDCPFLQNIEV